jgi:mitochondrial import receptor subunit TOM70
MSGGGVSASSSSTSPISLQTAPAGSSSFWDRLSQWASENKAVVYTIAGVTVIATGAGIYYYTSAPKEEDAGAAEKRKAKRDKRKAKKSDEKAKEDGKAGK